MKNLGHNHAATAAPTVYCTCAVTPWRSIRRAYAYKYSVDDPFIQILLDETVKIIIVILARVYYVFIAVYIPEALHGPACVSKIISAQKNINDSVTAGTI